MRYRQRGLDLLAAGNRRPRRRRPFARPSPPIPRHVSRRTTAWCAPCATPAGWNKSVAAALALTALTPADPLAHTALSISLQTAGHVPEAEAAAARARVLEWKIQLQSPPSSRTRCRETHPWPARQSACAGCTIAAEGLRPPALVAGRDSI